MKHIATKATENLRLEPLIMAIPLWLRKVIDTDLKLKSQKILPLVFCQLKFLEEKDPNSKSP